MTVVPLDQLPARAVEPDEPPAFGPPATDARETFASALQRALDGAAGQLERADAAERAFSTGRGSLQSMVLERAQADVTLSIATAAASRTAQALTTILSMQL